VYLERDSPYEVLGVHSRFGVRRRPTPSRGLPVVAFEGIEQEYPPESSGDARCDLAFRGVKTTVRQEIYERCKGPWLLVRVVRELEGDG